MKKTIVLVSIALAASLLASAQSSSSKPSAGTKHASSTTTTTQSGPKYADEAGTLPAKTTLGPSYDNPSDLPAGTAINMKLETPLNSRTNKQGDSFSGRVVKDVVIGGKTVIPVGSSITGRVTQTADPRRIGGVGTISMLPLSVILPNGKTYAIIASVVDTSTPNKLNVNDEGQIKAKGLSKGDKIEMAAGTGAGLIIGGIADGGKGMLIGSAIGGGATVIHWLTKKHTADVPAGTELIMEISRPMSMSGQPMQTGE